MRALSLSLLVACTTTPPAVPDSPDCTTAACDFVSIEPERYAVALQPGAMDVRAGLMALPELDGLAFYDLDGPGVPRVGAWAHPTPLSPVEVTFTDRDDEVVLRTTDEIWWVTDPSDPFPVGSLMLSSAPWPTDPGDPADTILSTSRVAVLVASDTSFTVIDRSDPAAPSVAAEEASAADTLGGACLSDDQLVLLRSTDVEPTPLAQAVDLVVYDLSEPAAPRLLQTLALDDQLPWSLSCDGARVVTTTWREVTSWVRQPDGTLQQASVAAASPPAIWAHVEGDRALLQLREPGDSGTLHVLDLAALDGGAPWADAVGPPLDDEPNPYAIVGADEGVVWVDERTDEGRLLQPVDWQGDTPTVEPSRSLGLDGGYASRVRVYGDLAVVGDPEPRLFDVSCPAEPVEVTPPDTTPWTALDSGLDVRGGVLVSRSGALELVSMADPMTPTVLDRLPGAMAQTSAGTRFAAVVGGDVVLGAADGQLSTRDLGCVAASGDPTLGEHSDCQPAIGVALTTDRLVVLTYGDVGSLVHVYALEGDAVVWEGSVPSGGVFWCRLVSDGVDVAIVEIDRAWPLSVADRAVGPEIGLPETYLPLRVHQGRLLAAGAQLHRWDLATGDALPPTPLPVAPLSFDLHGDVMIGAGGAAPLLTVDPSCQGD